jgi:hypothetical protein
VVEPSDMFQQRNLSVEEVRGCLLEAVETCQAINPTIRVCDSNHHQSTSAGVELGRVLRRPDL